MKNTTLCYIEQDGMYLMMHRNKKNGDCNRDKWIGIGGHIEENESPYDCILREAKEETGLWLQAPSYRGLITFCSPCYETEFMHLFTANDFDGSLRADCPEGDLQWISREKLFSLPMWESDKIFFASDGASRSFFSSEIDVQCGWRSFITRSSVLRRQPRAIAYLGLLAWYSLQI